MNDKINKLVHQALTGDCFHITPDYRETPDAYSFPCKFCGEEFGKPFHALPDYCSDLNAAFKFVEKLIADDGGGVFDLERLPVTKRWDAIFRITSGVYSEADESPAKAICLAGLSALNINTVEIGD
jgi:hypothetical protein